LYNTLPENSPDYYPMKPTNFIRGLLPLVLLTACVGLSPASTPTPMAVANTGTPTPTIIWFPPTNTATFFPTGTVLPTPEQHPGITGLLFTDTFDQPTLWNTPVSSSASAAVKLNRLVLSITANGPLPLLSLRSQPVVGDFYAEATATISLCAGKDQFGMIFRAASAGDYYAFRVSCDGTVSLARVTSGSTLPLLDWLSTGDAPIGAPAEVKLGVWAVGREMRFFLNDQFQFSFRDPVLKSGALGFFVRVERTAPITASFSDLSVYSVLYTSPTPSPNPSRTPIPSRTPSK
jgi:hypothetical protein